MKSLRVRYLAIEDKIVMKIQQEMDALESKSPSPVVTYILCSIVAVLGAIGFFLLLIIL